MWPRSALGTLAPPVPTNRPQAPTRRKRSPRTGYPSGQGSGDGDRAQPGALPQQSGHCEAEERGRTQESVLVCHKQGSGWSLPLGLRLLRGLHGGLCSWRWILPGGHCIASASRSSQGCGHRHMRVSLRLSFRVSLSAPGREHLILETA